MAEIDIAMHVSVMAAVINLRRNPLQLPRRANREARGYERPTSPGSAAQARASGDCRLHSNRSKQQGQPKCMARLLSGAAAQGDRSSDAILCVHLFVEGLGVLTP